MADMQVGSAASYYFVPNKEVNLIFIFVWEFTLIMTVFFGSSYTVVFIFY